jgi:hypothetical protein
MRALKNSLIRAQNLFSTRQSSHFAANAKLSATAVQTLRLRSQSCESMVPEKIFDSLYMSPFFSYAKAYK